MGISRLFLILMALLTASQLAAQTLDWKFEAVPRGVEHSSLVWEVSSNGQVVTAVRDGVPTFDQRSGLDGSLIGDNSEVFVSGSFVVTMTAAQNFDSGDFSYENAEPPGGTGPWLYNNANYFLGVSSRGAVDIELDGGIPDVNSSTGYYSEAIVFEFDLSNLSIADGYALQFDGLYLRNTQGALRISFLGHDDPTVRQLAGIEDESNPIVVGDRVFQKAPRIVRSGDRVALWSYSALGNRQFVGVRFSIVKAPNRVSIFEPSA